jgi:hypothetical protein
MNFDVQPSPEYTRLRTAADALRQQMKDLPKTVRLRNIVGIRWGMLLPPTATYLKV